MCVQDEKKCIFFIVDSNFYNHICICLRSIKANYKKHPDIVICSIDLESSQKTKLTDIVPLTFIETDLSLDEEWPVMKTVKDKVNPLCFWSRFLIWKNPIFKSYTKVLYLDCDTIILKPLDQIFEFDFYIEHDICAKNNNIFFLHSDRTLTKLLLNDGLKLNLRIANAGVFCVGKKFLKDYVFEDFISIKNNYIKYIKYGDQSVLNLWILKNHIYISDNNLFNFQYSGLLQGNYFSKLTKAYIIHFNGLDLRDRYILMSLYFLFTDRFGFLLHFGLAVPLFIKSFLLKVFIKIVKYAH